MSSRNRKNTRIFAVLTVAVLLSSAVPAGANHVSLATEKGCYNLNSNVKFTLTNNGQQVVTLTDGKPWEARDANGNIVYSPFRDNTVTDVDSGDTISWSWNQRKSNGQPVPAGSYKIVIHTNMFDPDDGANLETQFNVAADADEDCIADAADTCPNDATNSCLVEEVSENVPLPPVGGNTGIICELYKWCPDNPDADGILTSAGDGCPEQSGPDYNNGCPDYIYKNKVRETRDAALTVTVATTIAAAFGGPVFWAGAGIGEAIVGGIIIYDSNERIRKDPPDSNYRELAKLEYRDAVLLPEGDEGNYTLNRLITAALNYNAAAKAFVHSNERFMGAEIANDREWARKQASLTRFYGYKTAEALSNLNDALTEYQIALSKYGANRVITRRELEQFQKNLRESGLAALPQYELDFARSNLFYSIDEINFLKDSALEINSAAWRDMSTVDIIEKFKDSNNKFIIALENHAGRVGSNAAWIPNEQGGYDLRIENMPSDFKRGLIFVKTGTNGYPAVAAGNLAATSWATGFGMNYYAIFVSSQAGIKQGSSGTLLRLFSASRPPEVVWTWGDTGSWVFAKRLRTIVRPDKIKIVSVYPAAWTVPAAAGG